MVLERQYVIPLRKKWLKVPTFRRAKKGTRAVREFCARHFRVDEENVKIGKWLNEEIWARGMKNPPHKVKVKAVKDDKGIVKVELFELSEMAKKFEEREAKRRSVIDGKKKEEAKKKEEEEKARKEMESKAEKKIDEKVEEKMEESQKKADNAQKVNVEEEKLMKKTIGKEHQAPKPNVPHEKHQSKHPVRKVQEK